MPDKLLICKDCSEDFEFTQKEQELFKRKGWNNPFRCPQCRAKRKQDLPKQDQQRG